MFRFLVPFLIVLFSFPLILLSFPFSSFFARNYRLSDKLDYFPIEDRDLRYKVKSSVDSDSKSRKFNAPTFTKFLSEWSIVTFFENDKFYFTRTETTVFRYFCQLALIGKLIVLNGFN